MTNNNPNKDLLLHFARTWEKKYDSPYNIVWQKDGAIFKRLLANYGAETLQRLIDFYLGAYRNDFADNAGRNISVFAVSLPALITGLKKEATSKPISNPDFERIEAARERLKNG